MTTTGEKIGTALRKLTRHGYSGMSTPPTRGHTSRDESKFPSDGGPAWDQGALGPMWGPGGMHDTSHEKSSGDAGSAANRMCTSPTASAQMSSASLSEIVYFFTVGAAPAEELRLEAPVGKELEAPIEKELLSGPNKPRAAPRHCTSGGTGRSQKQRAVTL